MLLAGSLAYLIIRLVGTTEDSFAYGYPILFASIAYLNIRIVIAGNALIIGSNVIRFLLLLSAAGENRSMLVVNLFAAVLVAFSSVKITMLLKRFEEENIDIISKAAKKQEECNRTGLMVSNNIIQHFHEAMERMDSLSESLSTSNFSMSNIADSTESTADASKDVEHVISELTEKVYDVENFVSSIINISSQTNLLALNASIEVARAGAAGKGFAVVAEEIRKLSEETQAASNNITSIIQELNADTRRANESIETAVGSVSMQNELIKNTKGKFEEVEHEVSALIENINQMNTVMHETMESTGVISDNISHLSATSQEVASSSSEGLNNSQITVVEIQKCKEIFDAIYVLAQDLQRSLETVD